MSRGCGIELEPLDGSPLVRDYLSMFDRVARFFPAGRPDLVATFRASAQRARERMPEAAYRALAEVLRPTGPEASRRLQRVIRGRGVVVTTGQQPGLFTGPLYSLYKAMTAARLASRLEEALGLPAVGVFWVASEDHDWAEVNHVHIVDLENQLRRLEVSPDVDVAERPPPILRLSFASDVAGALATLAEQTPESEFKAEVLRPLGEAYRAGANVAGAFAQALADLMRPLPLCLVDAADPWIKAQSLPVLEREWARRHEIGDRLAAWSREIESAGYEPQVRIDGDATNLFVEGSRGRERVQWEGRGGRRAPAARLRRSGETLPEDELLRILRQDPVRISPNVLLRPVVESAVLPVVAYVGGPSEIAYFAQVPPLFELHDVPLPPVVARASVRLVEARVARALEKTGIDPAILSQGPEAAARRAAREHIPEALEVALRSIRASLDGGFESLREEIVRVDPPLGGAVGKARSQVERALEELEAKVTTSVQRKNKVLLDQLRKAAVHLWPLSQPQERVLNAYPYLVRYGRSLLAEIAEQISLPLE